MPDRRFEAIIFDWDGTLSDSTDPIALCMQAACRDLGLTVPSTEQAKHVIGLGLADALGRLVPELPPTEYGRLVDAYRVHYLRRSQEHPLFDGVAGLLTDLAARGHRLGVATGKSRPGLERSLQSAALSERFHAVRTADLTAPKPDPAMLLELIEALEVPAERMLMVGDTAFDLEMASRAGVAALAVSYGAHPVAELRRWPALAYLDTPAALCAWLRANA
jgi:phosphoglycolate phosphatase